MMMASDVRRMKMVVLALLCAVWTIFSVPPHRAEAANTTYYVDDVAGNDANSGTSPSTAWKTLAKANSQVLQPGDKLLFKAGGKWTGTLQPQGSGTASNRIEIGRYGDGPDPIINGNGASYAVFLRNMQYVTLQNFEITNNAATPARRSGVYVVGQNAGTLNGIYLRNLNIHDVKGISDRDDVDNFYGNAGIFVTVWTGSGNTNLSRYHDLRIENNNIHDIYTIGIYFGGTNLHLDDVAPFSTWYTGVVVRQNIVSRTGGDGIVVGISHTPLIERNAVYDAGINSTNLKWIAGMWSWASLDPTFQYNEVARTQFGVQSTSDSMAFNTDVFSQGKSTFQFNYSHSNKGGFLMSTPHLEQNGGYILARYNISQNDHHNHWSDNTISSHSGHAKFYNNVFFNNTSSGFKVDGTHGTGHTFINNIFHVTAGPVSLPAVHTYDYNLYYGFTAPAGDAHAVTGDPQFVNPGTGSDGIATAAGYKLKSTSPAINAGLSFANPGPGDFWGNPLYNGRADIGAHERP